MKTVQVLVGLYEFIGKTDNKVTDPVIKLKMPARVEQIADGRVKIMNMDKLPNYLCNEIEICNGPGVVVLPLNDKGNYAQTYRKIISSLVLAA